MNESNLHKGLPNEGTPPIPIPPVGDSWMKMEERLNEAMPLQPGTPENAFNQNTGPIESATMEYKTGNALPGLSRIISSAGILVLTAIIITVITWRVMTYNKHEHQSTTAGTEHNVTSGKATTGAVDIGSNAGSGNKRNSLPAEHATDDSIAFGTIDPKAAAHEETGGRPTPASSNDAASAGAGASQAEVNKVTGENLLPNGANAVTAAKAAVPASNGMSAHNSEVEKSGSHHNITNKSRHGVSNTDHTIRRTNPATINTGAPAEDDQNTHAGNYKPPTADTPVAAENKTAGTSTDVARVTKYSTPQIVLPSTTEVDNQHLSTSTPMLLQSLPVLNSSRNAIPTLKAPPAVTDRYANPCLMGPGPKGYWQLMPQWSAQLPVNGSESWYKGPTGNSQLYKILIPGIRAERTWPNAALSLDLNAIATQAFNNKWYDTVPYIGSGTNTIFISLVQTYGYSATLSYSHRVKGNWFAGIGAQAYYGRLAGKQRTYQYNLAVDTFRLAQFFGDKTEIWNAIGRFQGNATAEIYYDHTKWQAAIRTTIPVYFQRIEPLADPIKPKMQLELLFRWKIIYPKW
ncbi:hypothetical protein SAMN05444266_101790 [Chitinophaga jiangningensis]|uniref:Uncharacterized protein n=1 Tax=Chitinophaga jiangningensis TaxID=1419482 RepID=A0A1M6WW35_9BACT|nr:hypothetical protein [Chitinophaga jiangningensis]SHK97933.1 hypothetical protein SAMN05444266_101790 [Chitinophaga jiangningensis]